MVVTVNALPIVSVGPYSDLCNTDPFFTITGGSPSGGTYTGPGVIGGIFDPATAGAGMHTIMYEFTDANGCTDSSFATITIDDCIGVEELSDVDVSVYPNPASNELTVEVDGKKIEMVHLYDASGRLVKQILVNDEEIKIGLNGLSKGMYTVELKFSDTIYRTRVMKQ